MLIIPTGLVVWYDSLNNTYWMAFGENLRGQISLNKCKDSQMRPEQFTNILDYLNHAFKCMVVSTKKDI